jgi:hypothetical protein
MARLNLSIEDKLKSKVQIKCFEEGTNMSKVVSELLENWVAGQEIVTPPKQVETKKETSQYKVTPNKWLFPNDHDDE